MVEIPHNVEAETALLGAMLLTSDALHEGVSRLEAHRFYNPTNQAVFAAMARLFEAGTALDVVTLAAQLHTDGHHAIGQGQLMSMSAGTPAATNAAHYVDIVDEMARRRDLLIAAHDLTASIAGETASEDLLNEHQQRLFDIAAGNTGDSLQLLGDSISEALDALEERAAGTQIPGSPTGFNDLDRLTSGLAAASLTVIGARPAMGKTSLALDIVRHLSIDLGRPAILFSLEMSKQDLNNRLMSTLAKVDSSKIRSGQDLTPDDWKKIATVTQKIHDAPLWIDDAYEITLSSILAKSRRAHARSGGLSAILVDYLQLMRGRSGADNRQVEIAEISRGLKVLARELNCPVIALSQLHRGLEQRTDKRPQLSDLRESGAIEQDADNVIFIYRDEVYNSDSADAGTAEVILAKHRNGPTGTVRLAWRPRYTTFANLAHG